MKTKTKHRIAADKVVIEDDRRVEEGDYTFDRMESDNSRQTPHDYSQPLKIIYVPIEPPPYRTNDAIGWWCADGHISGGLGHGLKRTVLVPDNKVAEFLLEKPPFHPADTLILLEEWLDGYTEEDIYLCDLAKHCSEIQGDANPAPTMPPSLDSQCQQHNVRKVMGVEERWGTSDEMVLKRCGVATDKEDEVLKIWHWKLLANL